MNDGLSVVLPLIVLLTFASFIVAAVAYFRSEAEPEGLQRRFLPRFYAYAMLFVSCLMLLVGGGLLLKAALSYPLGVEFSYPGQPVYAQVEQPQPLEPYPRIQEPVIERIEYREENRVADLLNGATFAAAGGLFVGLHWVLRSRVESKEERRLSFLNRAYLATSGVVFGGLCLVLVPMGLYKLIDFYLVPRVDVGEFWSWPVPGETLGYALVALALWLWTLPQLFASLRSADSEG
jgi:hypothetical protein